MTSDIRKQATLVKTVFGGAKGKELLEMLEADNQVGFTSDPHRQYYLIGRSDLIREIRGFLNSTEEDIKRMEEADSYSVDDDF